VSGRTITNFVIEFPLLSCLKNAGKGPREMKVGKRVLITPEAEADWRREREANS
jgi:hypothetical protein